MGKGIPSALIKIVFEWVAVNGSQSRSGVGIVENDVDAHTTFSFVFPMVRRSRDLSVG